MHLALKNLTATLLGIGLITGSAGCYVPGGGWTLRSGIDWRTGHKPAAFVELVDTKWDEWNRVSQMNMFGAPLPPTAVIEPIPATIPGSEPILAPAAATSNSSPNNNRPSSQSDSPPGPTQREAEAPSQEVPAVPNPPPVEEVPPPQPGNTSAGTPRDRFRRSQNAIYQPQSNRTNLLPAAAGRNSQSAERDEELQDLGPVTIDLPESVPQPPAAGPKEQSQQPNDYRRLVAPSRAAAPAGTPSAQGKRPSVRANRPLPQNRLQGQRTTSKSSAWLFARP
jgi:hypothetical protein